MNNSNGQFFDFMKSFINPEILVSAMKNTPVVDFSSFTGTVKKNAEVLTTTNQMAAESIQAIAKRSAEVFQNNATDMFNAVKNMVSVQDLEQAAACQHDYVKSAFENSINNTKELMDMASKSSMEIFGVVGKNMTENVSKAFDKVKPKA